jgi:hypothetical protein
VKTRAKKAAEDAPRRSSRLKEKKDDDDLPLRRSARNK